MAISLKTNIRSLPGIGDSRAKVLAKLGVSTVEELLYHFPRAYEFRGNIKTLSAACDGETASFFLTVSSTPSTSRVKNNMTVTKFSAFDETAKCTVTFFNQNHLRNVYKTASTYRFYGKLVKFGKQYELVSPVAEPISEHLLPLFPVYPAASGMSTHQIFQLVSNILDYAHQNGGEEIITENLPQQIVREYKLQTRYEAIVNIHRPLSFDALNGAKRRLIFEELFSFAHDLLSRKSEYAGETAVAVEKCELTPFYERLTFSLTNAQKRTIDEIMRDITAPSRKPMRRVLCGDVGCGKTVCAMAALYAVASSGHQCAMMAPTEVLARQHYNDMSDFFESLGIKVVLLISDMSRREKQASYEMISGGDASVIIGTQALLTDKVSFSSLGLVICDEQHRFGVNQRSTLLQKGNGVNMLVMSATPIPRTLAMVMFGDLDVSMIDELPPKRKQISTYVVNEEYRTRLYEFIRKEVSGGHQVYIVCPEVDDAQTGEDEIPLSALTTPEHALRYTAERGVRRAAVPYAQHLSTEVFPTYSVGYMHGKMKSSEKSRIMEQFNLGKIDILVSTTVIEVGVNVPNATLMVVENAECFGLAQLHQLRGRVGRSEHKSYCIYVSSSPGSAAMKRLSAMKETDDGYRIAEQDLKLRGPGDFIERATGYTRQHGSLKMKLAGMLDDPQLLYSAFSAAESQIKNNIDR